jgi:uncharacterized protein (DUF1800 family)
MSTLPSASAALLDAAIAAHRFGLGEPTLAVVGNDPRGWLHAQVGPADAALGSGLPDTALALSNSIQLDRQIQAARKTAASDPAADERLQVAKARDAYYRDTIRADLRSRLASAATSTRPLAERLVLFWSNHFTVSLAKTNTRGLVGAFERDAIRPHVAGRFEDLLYACVTHPAMLRYLDNQASAGPHSRIAVRTSQRPVAGQRPRVLGLNENLAREVMELHTLGVNGGYTQADVTAFAAVLTGWRQPTLAHLAGGAPAPGTFQGFDAAWHEPGTKTVLGRSYPEGPQALFMVLHDLASHPSTARFVSTKLARQFVADEPPPALVERLTVRYLRSGGDLAALMHGLIDAPEAWSAEQRKLKTPEEFAISSARMLGLRETLFERNDLGGFQTLGQRVQYAPSPAGWADSADDWLGPDAVWKRVEWSARQAARFGNTLDARALAAASLGPQMSPSSTEQIARAADGPQALALLLMSPEFQRR